MEIFNALLNLKRLWHKCTVQALDKRKAIFFLLLILPAILNAGKDTVSSQDLVNIEVTRGGNGIFRVVFFSGVRFADGLGDLTLNKYCNELAMMQYVDHEIQKAVEKEMKAFGKDMASDKPMVI